MEPWPDVWNSWGMNIYNKTPNEMNTQKAVNRYVVIALSIYAIFTTLLCVSNGIEIQQLEAELNEETELKYEYSIVIDSLTNELEIMRHWYEFGDTEPVHSEWEHKHNKAVQW